MRNLLFILLILDGSSLAAQEQDNRFNESKNEEAGSSVVAQKQDNIFNGGEQEEVVTSEFGPGTDTPGGDLEDEEAVPIDNYSVWLFIVAIGLIIFYRVQRKKTLIK